MLPSGLSEVVADAEDLARFLTSSSQFNAQMAKPVAFLPGPKGRETSVFRHGAQPRAALWAIGGWPWLENDLELQKAKQKELAALVASKATLLRR